MEVLVALSIAALSAAALFEVISSSTGRQLAAGERQLAVLQARSLMAGLSWTVTDEEIDSYGRLDNGLQWSVSRAPDVAGSSSRLVAVEVAVETRGGPPVRLTSLRVLVPDR